MAKIKQPAQTDQPTDTVSGPPSWMPTFESQTIDSTPRLPPQPPRLLKVHPERWTVLEGQVVPLCGHLHLRAGVSRVQQRRDGTYLIREAIAAQADRGWTVIPADVDGSSYIYEAAPGTYLLRWEQAHAGSSTVTSDTRGYADWLRKLIADGKIPAPRPYALEALRAKYARRVDQLTDDTHRLPSLRPELEQAVKDLRCVEAEIKLRAAPVKSTPVNPSTLIAAEE